MDQFKHREPLTPQDRWIYFGFIAFVGGCFIAALLEDYRPIKLAGVLVAVFWVPMIALHEGGHALAAHLCGWYVGQIVVGVGRTVYRFRIGTALVEFRSVPVAGFIRCVPRNLNNPRLKDTIIYAAGPGIELVLAGVIVLLVGPAKMLEVTDNYLLIVVQSLSIAALVGAITNLLPMSIHTESGKVPNDGMGILTCSLRSDEYYASLIGRTFNAERGEWEEYEPAAWWKRK